MWNRGPYHTDVPDSDLVELPEWWGPCDYLALFIALFQSIAVPFLVLALFFLLASVAITALGG